MKQAGASTRAPAPQPGKGQSYPSSQQQDTEGVLLRLMARILFLPPPPPPGFVCPRDDRPA